MPRKTYISNRTLSLVEYLPEDDRALYDNWLEPGTVAAFNGVRVGSFETFRTRKMRQRFFAMISLDATGEIIGAVGISPPETAPDLAIWMFKPYRRQGHGSAAFALATQYAVRELGIERLHAGLYPGNIASQKMLQKCAYIPNPDWSEADGWEKHYLTGEEIRQLDYVFVL